MLCGRESNGRVKKNPDRGRGGSRLDAGVLPVEESDAELFGHIPFEDAEIWAGSNRENRADPRGRSWGAMDSVDDGHGSRERGSGGAFRGEKPRHGLMSTDRPHFEVLLVDLGEICNRVPAHGVGQFELEAVDRLVMPFMQQPAERLNGVTLDVGPDGVEAGHDGIPALEVPGACHASSSEVPLSQGAPSLSSDAQRQCWGVGMRGDGGYAGECFMGEHVASVLG